jgi:capsular exopolysaccharide synthesis family protein
MDLKELVTLYRQWVWLLILSAVLGLASGYAASRIQEPVYEASAKVLVTRTRQPGTTDILSISDQQLVLTYVQLLKTRSVLDEVGLRHDTKVDPKNVRVDVIADTQIIQIKVQDTNVTQAAAIANELVRVLIEQNEVLQAGRYTAYEQGLNSQVAQVQEQIDALQSQIAEINKAEIEEQLNLVNRQISDLQEQITVLEQDIAKYPALLSNSDRAKLNDQQSQLNQLRSILSLYQEIQMNLVFLGKPTQGTASSDSQVISLQATLALYQQLYLNLLNNLETVKLARAQSTPTVTTIEEAVIPKSPIRPIPLLYTALSGIVGLFLAAGAILLMDYFDDTLRSAQKIREALGLPVLGQITKVKYKKKNNGSSPFADRIDSPLSHAFGSLRINVGRLIEEKPIKTILITSPSSGEGKTTISVNLAGAFARSGNKVVLLDADFYHPQIHTQLGLNNKRGLSHILVDDIEWQQVAHSFGGIDVITSGLHSSDATAFLESKRMSQLLESLHRKADVIILDGPPLFIEDCQILASKVAGVLLVVRQGTTLAAEARAMLEQLRLIDANILGVVFNDIAREKPYYFNGYYQNVSEEILEEKAEKILNVQS